MIVNKKQIFVGFALLAAVMFTAVNVSTSVRASLIHTWFEMGTYASFEQKDLHKYSQWVYLSDQEFSEIIHDALSKMPNQMKNSDEVYELGMGVGAALKVIRQDYPGISIGGSDYSKNAIAMAQDVFVDDVDHFVVHDMTLKHECIADNTYDHVFSFGALGMYLTKPQMLDAIQEAVRIAKPGGSLVFTHFIESGAYPRKSIVEPVEKSYWLEVLPKLGIKNIQIEPMLHQGDRYQIICQKS
jgi:ubiquinone/menaquinone biosynthesis C-methylase UbiE